jgi:hypothetical protein
VATLHGFLGCVLQLMRASPYPPVALAYVCVCLGGLATVLLESRAVLCSSYLRKRTAEYFKFLSFQWGRGVLYLALGLLTSMIRYPSVPQLVVGGYFLLLGAVSLLFGLWVMRRLQALRETLTEDEKVLREKFDQYDPDHEGRVNAGDLALICADLGSRLSHSELETAILTLDVRDWLLASWLGRP